MPFIICISNGFWWWCVVVFLWGLGFFFFGNLPSRYCELTSLLRRKCPPGRSFAMTETVESRVCPNSRKKHAIIFFIFRKQMDIQGCETAIKERRWAIWLHEKIHCQPPSCIASLPAHTNMQIHWHGIIPTPTKKDLHNKVAVSRPCIAFISIVSWSSQLTFKMYQLLQSFIIIMYFQSKKRNFVSVSLSPKTGLKRTEIYFRYSIQHSVAFFQKFNGSCSLRDTCFRKSWRIKRREYIPETATIHVNQ